MNSYAYVAFLRGINVGGHKKVSMAELKKVFEEQGFTDVKTLLNSGNVVFTAPRLSQEKIAPTVTKILTTFLGYDISVMIRSIDYLKQVMATEPFKGIEVTPKTRLYVTFLAEKHASTLKLPYLSAGKDFQILSTTHTEVFSVLTLSEAFGTVDSMAILEKEFGKQVTTRNWNTVLRIIKLFS